MKTSFSIFCAIALLSMLLCGCTTGQVARNVYEGTKNRAEALRSAPPDYTRPRAPSYDDYDRERRGLSPAPAL